MAISANILTMTNMMRPTVKKRRLEEDEDERPELVSKTLGSVQAAASRKQPKTPRRPSETLEDDAAGFGPVDRDDPPQPASPWPEKKRSTRKPGSKSAARKEEGDRTSNGRSSGARKTSKPMTEARLRNIAEHYVGQRECSRAMLRSVLERRLSRRLSSIDPEEAVKERDAAEPLIEAQIDRLVRAGFIDDQRFAEMKARSWLGSGRGSRRILMDLKQKGIEDDTAQDALAAASREITGMRDEGADVEDAVVSAEWEAAEAFARKKRVGKYRRDPLPEDRKERAKIWRREASAMARAGFGIDMIRQVIDEEPEDDVF